MRKNCSFIFGVDLRPCALAVQLVAALAVLFVHAVPASAQNPPVTIAVDANANRRPINPNIYGVAHATTAQLNDLNSPLNRNGGNNTTRYNWQLNADNRGNDWYFESIADRSADRRRARRYVLSRTRERQTPKPMLTIPTIDWVAKLGANRDQARELLDRQIRRADRQRLAVVPRCRQRRSRPTASSSPATIRTMPMCRPTSAFQQGWVQHWSAAGARTQRRPALLHPRQRAQHLALDAPRRPSDRRDDGRDQRQDRSTTRARSKPSTRRAGRRPRRVGLERLLLQRLRPAIRQPARLERHCRTATRTAARIICLAARSDAAEQTSPPASGCSTCSPCTTIRRAASSATTCRTRCSCGATARRARLWDPNYVDETWINDACSLMPRLKSWVNTYYPGHADRHHRVQLGRRGPHQRRDDAGRHLRHLRPRRSRHGRALDDAGRLHADLQGDEAVSQLRRQQVDVRRHQRRCDGAQSRQRVCLRGPAIIGRCADGDSDQQYLASTTPVTVTLANVTHRGTAQAWQLTSANAITRLADVTMSGNSLVTTLPAQSITLFVVPTNGSATPPGAPTNVRIVSGGQ